MKCRGVVIVVLAGALCAVAAASAPAFLPTGPSSGFRISITGGESETNRDALDPAVAYNSRRGEFLVVYRADPLATDSEFEIFAQRVRAGGGRVGARIQVSAAGPGGDDSYSAGDPSVAYNPKLNQYLVAFEAENLATEDEFEVWAQRMSGAGVPLGGEIRVSETNVDGDSNRDGTDPDVAYGSRANRYMVTWEGDDGEAEDEDEVHFQLLSARGDDVGSDTRISATGPGGDDAFDAVDAEAAYNARANQFLVVWDADLPNEGENEIFAQLFTAAGGPLGPNTRISTAGPEGDVAYDAVDPDVAYGPRRNQYMVTWEGDGSALNELEIYVQRLSASGAQLGGEPRVSTTGAPGDQLREAFDPRIAYAARQNQFLVTWEGDPLATENEFEVFAQRIGASGRQLDKDFRVSTTGPDGEALRFGENPAVAAGNGVFLVPFDGDDLLPDKFEIFGRRIAAPRCFGKTPTVVGTKGRDTLRGTAGADVIVGLGSSDTLIGRGGRDRLCGNKGRDRLRGGPGRDRTRQ